MEFTNRMRGSWHGAMPLQAFLDTYLPLPDNISDPPTKAFDCFKEVEELLGKPTFTEKALTEAFTVGFSRAMDILGLEEKLVMKYGDRKDRSIDDPVRTDANWYAYGTPNLEKKPVQYDKSLVTAEFKCKPTADPFESYCKKLVTPQDISKLHNSVLGQLYHYSSLINNYQYRNHVFQILICGRYARFLRWDHAGCVFSDKFDYLEDQWGLLEFFYRFCNLDDFSKGIDTRFTLGKEDDIALANQHLGQWMGNDTHKDRDVVTFQVYNKKEQRNMELVAKYHYKCRTHIIGRGTRCIVVWNKTKNELNFYKDSWRPLSEGQEAEADIIEELRAGGVTYIPTLLGGGDLVGCDTRSHACGSYIFGTLREGEGIVERRLSCVLMREVGRTLDEANGLEELLYASYHAFLGHEQAVEFCKMLHRDISVGNLLIVDNDKEGRRGILIDWERARSLDSLRNGPSQIFRTGTWHFMSWALSRWNQKRHQTQDDLEGFIHVLCYVALRYFQSNIKPNMLSGGFKKLYGGHSAAYKELFFTRVDRVFIGTHRLSFPGRQLLSKWISEARTYALQWTSCDYSNLDIDGNFIEDDINGIPQEIRLRDHKALKSLWKELIDVAEGRGFFEDEGEDAPKPSDRLPLQDRGTTTKEPLGPDGKLVANKREREEDPNEDPFIDAKESQKSGKRPKTDGSWEFVIKGKST